MAGTQDLWLFVISGVLLNLTPGADTLYIVGRSAGQGLRAGICAALGICSGTLVHVLAAALGLSAVLASSATAFLVVKFLGAVYLVYLGIAMWRQRGGSAVETVAPPPASLTRNYRQGLLTNVLNPKVALFFLAFMPQFVAPSAPSQPLALLVLGVIFALNSTLWCLFLAWSAAAAGQRVRISQRMGRWLNRAAGGCFVFFGVRLAFSEQH